MIGSAPVPVPITSRRQFQGISSSIERGVSKFVAELL
jgi:hypothetical protein